jgi:hypothetical protein
VTKLIEGNLVLMPSQNKNRQELETGKRTGKKNRQEQAKNRQEQGRTGKSRRNKQEQTRTDNNRQEQTEQTRADRTDKM